jgi:hypothetical protein
MMHMHAPHSIGTGTAIAIQTGSSHICMLRAETASTTTNSGDVLCWGLGSDGQLVSSITKQNITPIQAYYTHTFPYCFSAVYTFVS